MSNGKTLQVLLWSTDDDSCDESSAPEFYIKFYIYTVSGKKVTPCVLSYNSGKWCRILTKFCINNATSNCKRTAKFQWNLSTTATVIVVLVRAPKKWSVHYRQWQRQLTVKLCLRRNIEQYDCLKFVFDMSSACSNAGSKTLTPLFDRFVNDRLLELFPLFDQKGVTSADPLHESGCGRHAPAVSPKYGSPQYSGQNCWQATLAENTVLF